VACNPTVARIQALYATALWMAGRRAQAHSAARLAQQLSPPFSPDQMSIRGGKTASARYEAARDRNVAASRRRGVESSPNLLQCHMSAPGAYETNQRG